MINMIFFTLSDDLLLLLQMKHKVQSPKKPYFYKERAETIRTFLAEINISQCMTSLLKLETVCFFLAFIVSSFRVNEED